MNRKLILHIGAHRTATSALQDYLYQNIMALKKKGFLYPFKVRRHLKLVNNLFSGAQTPEGAIETLNARADGHKTEMHTIILSDEDICMRPDLTVLAGLRQAFDVKIVYSLRRQDTWLESWFLQNIKWQWNEKYSDCTFDQFMEMRADFHWIHYDRYVRHLEKLFGQENIILNIHEKQQMPNGPIDMFCDSIGLKDQTGFAPAKHMNASFSPIISEFMRCLPLDAAPQEYRGVLTAACARIDQTISQGGNQSKKLLAHEDRVALMTEYQEGNQALAQRYFGRAELFFDPLPGPDVPMANMRLPADSYELMESFVSPLLKAVIKHQEKVSVSPRPPTS